MLIRNEREQYIYTDISEYQHGFLSITISLLLIFTPGSPQDLVNTSHGVHSGAQVWLKLEKYKNC